MGIQSLPANAGTARIKRRIRDLERLLKKPGLAATKKTEAERAVSSFRAELDTAQHRKKEVKNARKYHMVRFVERKKALRALKKPGAATPELAAFYYITTYPNDRKYQALYADVDGKPASRETHRYLDEIYRRLDTGDLASGDEAIKAALRTSKSDSNTQQGHR